MQIGLLLSSKHHAEMLASGNKTMLIRARRFYRYVRIPVYLLADQKCYAKMVLGSPQKIDLSGFRALRSQHRVTEKEREQQWPDELDFYSYKVQVLETYDPPKKVKFPPTSQAWVRHWEWLDRPPKELHLEKVADLEHYHPSKIPDTARGSAILRDDARLLLAYWSSKRSGKDVKYTYDLLEQKYTAILRELVRRRAAQFSPQNYKPHARDLFDRAARTLQLEGITVPLRKSSHLKGLTALQNMTDKELLAHHDHLHQMYAEGKVTKESIVNAHIFAVQAMRHRGLSHKIEDDLDRELQGSAASRLVPFVIIDSMVCQTGSSVYDIRPPHDCDLVIRSDEEDSKMTAAILKAVNLPPSTIHRIYEPRGPSFDYVALLDYVAVPVAWKGTWTKKSIRPEDIPEHSWAIYRQLPPAVLVHDPFVTQSNNTFYVRDARRNTGIEIKLTRLLAANLSFRWRGEDEAMAGTPLFKSFLIPHIPLRRAKVDEPFFRRYY